MHTSTALGATAPSDRLGFGDFVSAVVFVSADGGGEQQTVNAAVITRTIEMRFTRLPRVPAAAKNLDESVAVVPRERLDAGPNSCRRVRVVDARATATVAADLKPVVDRIRKVRMPDEMGAVVPLPSVTCDWPSIERV